jgi:hypothetical protein
MSADITVQRQGRAMAAAERFSGDAGRSLDRLESCSISHRSAFDAFPQYEYPLQFKGLASKNAGFRFSTADFWATAEKSGCFLVLQTDRIFRRRRQSKSQAADSGGKLIFAFRPTRKSPCRRSTRINQVDKVERFANHSNIFSPHIPNGLSSYSMHAECADRQP